MKLSAFHTIIVTLAIMAFTPCMAAEQNEVSVKYLTAAIGSIANNTKVLVRGSYGDDLESVITWKGYSQFRIRDKEGNRFGFMICKTDGDVFRRLLDTAKGTPLLFECQKYQLEGRFNDCLVVLNFRAVETQKTKPDDSASKDKYKVTITSTAGSQTVVTNVSLNAPFQAGSLRITIEKENGR